LDMVYHVGGHILRNCVYRIRNMEADMEYKQYIFAFVLMAWLAFCLVVFVVLYLKGSI
jgi:energy-converting hydrogenase Eha subunit F